ncbi:MAG: hypothetical protein JSS12_04490 [Verrucomicrobia bacterium]|nr:hypothetical protein [Verrucomicrobiota bacterium]
MSVSFNLDSFINQADTILKSKEPLITKHEKINKLFFDNAAAMNADLRKFGSIEVTSEQGEIFSQAYSIFNLSEREAAQAELRTRNFTQKKDN